MQDAARAAALHAMSFETGWTPDSLKTHIKADLCLGHFSPALSGFIIIKSAADQAEIITLAVGPSARRQGVAGQLLNDAVVHLKPKNISILFLEVAEDNEAAIKLYRKSGFTPIGKRLAYYRRAGGRVAALTFRKDL